MRYITPASKVLLQGTQALMNNAMRKQLSRKHQAERHAQEYPIVFMHGFMGFNQMKLFGITLFDYFNGVQDLLDQMGYDVWFESVSPVNPPQIRARQWAQVVDNALAFYETDKVHIIAHSQGGVDARVLAAPQTNSCETPYDGALNGMGYGDKIASITTIGAPHLGTPLADANEDKGGIMEELFMAIIDLVAIMNGSSAKLARKTVASMSRTYMLNEFNPKIIVPNTIPCYTVAGNPLDKKDVSMMFDATWEELNKIPECDGGGPNDGFVPVSSAIYEGNKTKLKGSKQLQWQNLGLVCADHVAEVGIPIEFGTQNHFEHLPMFAGLAQNIDTCYRKSIQMELLNNGEWKRICDLFNKAA